MPDMPAAAPRLFRNETKLLAEFGQRLRLARLRRKLTTRTVAVRANMSRSTLHNAEAGDPAVGLGTYVRLMAVLGVEDDIALLAADDRVGRKLQDAELEPKRFAP